ncbi:MAG: cobalamin B12-binding domain-containing protein [Candidatus Rokubacteria bacterium]|nr:cobalamin B12-binding domain-containing protein [Candidatus Rokubacteria bacterium]
MGRVPGADPAVSPAAASGGLRGKRILIAKPGLDGHDVGAKVIALALRDAGADVIYTGLRKSPQQIARVAVDEDVHAVGLSVLSGSHQELAAETIERLRALGGGDIAVFLGGSIPPAGHAALRALGVKGVFTSDMPLEAVVAAVVRALA